MRAKDGTRFADHVPRSRSLQGGQRIYRPPGRRRTAAGGGAPSEAACRRRLPGPHRRRRVHHRSPATQPEATAAASAERMIERAQGRYRRRRPPNPGRPERRHRRLPCRRYRRDGLARQRRRRALPGKVGGARLDPLLRGEIGSAAARTARAADTTCARASSVATSSCITSRRRHRPARSSGSKRWCAGTARSAAWSRPETFIPIAEESALIIALGEWILREACKEAASWPNPLRVAVNISPVQFHHGDLAKLVHSILLETGLEPTGWSSRSPKAS